MCDIALALVRRGPSRDKLRSGCSEGGAPLKTLDGAGLGKLADALSATHDVFVPRAAGAEFRLARHVPGSPAGVPWNPWRLPEPLKAVWFQSGRVVARWPRGAAAPPAARPRAVFGVKACDLQALACLDRVFRDHEFREPAWCAARETTLVVAGDCTDRRESCFCTMMGGSPHPSALFDLCLSPLDGGFLVETGSPAGERVVAAHAALFRDAPAGAAERRAAERRAVAERVRAQNERFAVREPFEASVAKHERTGIWSRLAATCVECGACNMACPTCHCFLLHDVRTDGGAARLSVWDSCFHAGHARMAGGLTPRLQLTERFRNHYHHKFVAFPRNWGVTACSGCGRCVEACMGRIDKRDCLRRLETHWIPSAVAGEVD